MRKIQMGIILGANKLKKYFIQTYYQLPLYKAVWDNMWRFPCLINKMIEKKPPEHLVDDLENSVAVISFDTDMVPNWKDIYHEQIFWHWNTVRIKKKKEEDKNEKVQVSMQPLQRPEQSA